MGYIIILLNVAVILLGVKTLSARLTRRGRFAPDPFYILCACTNLLFVALALQFNQVGPENKMGPLVEVLVLYPSGIGFWLAGLRVLYQGYGLGEPLARFCLTLQCITAILYFVPLVQALYLIL
jgi:hypothetical protein